MFVKETDSINILIYKHISWHDGWFFLNGSNICIKLEFLECIKYEFRDVAIEAKNFKYFLSIPILCIIISMAGQGTAPPPFSKQKKIGNTITMLYTPFEILIIQKYILRPF